MASVALKLFIIFLIFLGVLVWYMKYRASPAYMTRLWRSMDDALRNIKITLFMSMHTIQERVGRDLQILEIGSGAGVNFRYYPDGSKVTLIDINPEFNNLVNENLKSQNTQVEVKDFVVCNAEKLSQFSDGSFDIVVGTFILSSCKRPDRVVEEVRRVLAPGGVYYFMENVFGKIGDKARVIQKLLNPIYPFMFGGIQLMATSDDVITNSGFAKVDVKRIEFEPPQAVLFPLRSTVCGTATKGDRDK